MIESTLGLTAFEFITRHLREQKVMPGFLDGYERIHHDEQRHIGYGVWYLREAAARDSALAERIGHTRLELLPAAAAALAPPEGADRALGTTAARSASSRSAG